MGNLCDSQRGAGTVPINESDFTAVDEAMAQAMQLTIDLKTVVVATRSLLPETKVAMEALAQRVIVSLTVIDQSMMLIAWETTLVTARALLKESRTALKDAKLAILDLRHQVSKLRAAKLVNKAQQAAFDASAALTREKLQVLKENLNRMLDGIAVP